MENITNGEFYLWVAPDGTPQLSSLAEDELTCIGFTKLLHRNGIGKSYHEMKLQGFKIEKVKLSLTQLDKKE